MSFKLKGKKATLITDPTVIKSLVTLTADIIILSSPSLDRKAAERVSGTVRRSKPYLIEAPGEYEVGGVGVFGWRETKDNTLFTIHVDGVSVGHLGKLSGVLTDEQVENLGLIDVLLISINPQGLGAMEKVVEVISLIQPSFVVPMDYDTLTLELFLKEMGNQGKQMDSLSINSGTQLDETEVVVLKPKE